MNFLDGQMELCQKPQPLNANPSSNKQQIVIWGVEPVTGPAMGPNTWTAQPPVSNGQPGGNAGYQTNPDSARAIDSQQAQTTGFTTGTRSITVSNFTGTGAPVPTGSTNLAGVAAGGPQRRQHQHHPRVCEQPDGHDHARRRRLGIRAADGDEVDGQQQHARDLAVADVRTNCLDTPAKINGATIAYSVGHSAASGTADPRLDGITLTVTYTPPAAAGPLNPQSGCITQAPYYSIVDHSPAADPDGAGPAPASCARSSG